MIDDESIKTLPPVERSLVEGLLQHLDQVNKILEECDQKEIQVTFIYSDSEDAFSETAPFIPVALDIIKVAKVLVR